MATEDKELKAIQAREKALAAEAKAQEKVIAQEQKRFDLAKLKLAATEKEQKALNEIATSIELGVELDEDRLITLGVTAERQKEIVADYRKAIAPLKEQKRLLKEINDEQEQNKESAEERTEELKKQKETLDAIKGVMSDINSIATKFTGIDFGSYFTDPIGTITSQLMELTLQVDAAQIATGRLTGGMKSLGAGTEALAKRSGHLAVSYGEAAEIQGELYSSMSDFYNLSVDMQKSLGDQAAIYKRLGVPVAEYAQAIDGLTRGMGLTVPAAQEAFKEMEAVSSAIGVGPSQMAQDFNSLSGEMAKYGTEGRTVFMGLQKAAKGLAIATQDAMKIAELFDTFSDAAQTVGLLNAQLGLGLNAVKMMKANEADRLGILRDQFAAQGKNFKDMHRREQQAVARMLNVDVSLAQRLFGDPIAFEEYNQKQKEAAERAEALTGLQEHMATILQELAPTLKEFADYLKSFILTIKENKTVVGGFIATLAGLGFVKNLGLWIAKVAAAFALLGPNVTLVIPAITAAGSALASLWAPILAIGGAIFMASAGMALMASAFENMSPEQIAATSGAMIDLALAMGIFAAVAALVGKFLPIIGPGLAVLGVFMLSAALSAMMLGAAMMMVGIGTQMALTPLLELAGQSGNLYAVASGILAIAGALAVMGAGGIVSFFTGNPLDQITDFARDLSEIGIDPTQMDAMANLMVTTSEVIQAAPEITDENVQRVRELADAVIVFRAMNEVSIASNLEALAVFLRTMKGPKTGAGKGGAASAQKPFEISVKIDSKEAARALWPDIKAAMNEN